MGQYYKFIILSDNKKNNKEVILLVINPRDYYNGSKIMEHSYINNNFMNAMEYLISPSGMFFKSRIIWAGDYANAVESEQVNEDGENLNLYRSAEQQYGKYMTPYLNEKFIENMDRYRYIINHTKKLYIDKKKCKNNNYEQIIHPLSLLVTDNCNGMGGGDYRGSNEHLCGTWTRDIISVDKTIDKLIDYKELECNFEE